MSFHVIYASGWTKVGARCKRVAMNEVAIVSGGARRPEVCKRFKPTLRVDQVMDACDWLFDLVTVDIHSLLVHLDLHSRGPMEEYYPFPRSSCYCTGGSLQSPGGCAPPPF